MFSYADHLVAPLGASAADAEGGSAAVGVNEALVPVLSGLVALLAVGEFRIWRILRIVVTIAHEGGHAVAALLSGRRLSGIRLHSDTSGLTVSRGRPSGPGMLFTVLAGYPAPSVLGLGVAGAVLLDQARPALVAGVVLLLGTAWYIRNLYGLFAVVVAGAVVAGVGWYGSSRWQLAFCSVLAWFLLLGGLRAVTELPRARRRRPDSDADQLGRLTGVPPIAWLGLFFTLSVGALALGGWWLVGDAVRSAG